MIPEKDKKTMSVQMRVHLPNLFNEIATNNPTMGIMTIPLNITRNILTSVAERSIELNDPILNALMMRLTLYSAADPECRDYDKTTQEKIIEQGDAFRTNPLSQKTVLIPASPEPLNPDIVEKMTSQQICDTLNKKLSEMGIEFGESPLSSVVSDLKEKEPIPANTARIYAYGTRGRNEGYYVYLELKYQDQTERKIMTRCIGSGKTWTKESLAEIVAALTLILSNF